MTYEDDELDRLHQASAFQGDDDLVFGHPVLERPLDRSKLLKRFKGALRVSGAGQFEERIRNGRPRSRRALYFGNTRLATVSSTSVSKAMSLPSAL
jgi:hypothetical protein